MEADGALVVVDVDARAVDEALAREDRLALGDDGLELERPVARALEAGGEARVEREQVVGQAQKLSLCPRFWMPGTVRSASKKRQPCLSTKL